MAKNNRVVDIGSLQDPSQIKSVEYNPSAGAEKVLIIGPRLIPIPIVTAGSPTWSTNISAATALPYLGANLAIYNNAGSAGSVTVGQASTVTSQAIGAFDSSGNVGVACPPNSYTYVSMGSNQWIIGSASTLIAYIIEDPTRIAQETGPYAQQNVPGTQLLPSS
jgi:hypothetical protein